MNLVDNPIFFPGYALGVATGEGRILDTLIEDPRLGRVYLHEQLIHEGARLLGYPQPDEVAELKTELQRLRAENKRQAGIMGHWQPVMDAMVAITEERALKQGAKHLRKDAARKEMVEALTGS